MATLADLEKTLEAIKAGKIPPLVLIYGDQGYLVKQAYDRLLEAVVPAELRAFNLEQLDGARIEATAIMDAFDIVPMMPGPKAVGVPDARFFQSKSNGRELLERSREAWESGETNASLRLLARVLALLGWNWEDARDKSLGDFFQALEIDAEPGEADWLDKALPQGANSQFPLPLAADEAGELAERIEAAFAREPQAGAQHSLIFAAAAADARKKLFKVIQDKGLIFEFKKEKKGVQATQTASVFLRNLLSQRNLSCPPATAQRLVSAYGHELGLLVKELDKLEAYVYPQKAISEEALVEVGSPQMEDSIFELLGALAKKDKGLGAALQLLGRLLEREHPLMIFNRMATEIRLLHLCKSLMDEGKLPARGSGDFFSYKTNVHPRLCQELDGGLAATFKKTHPFVLFQSFQRAKHFESGVLRSMLLNLLEADLSLKSSGGDPRLKLEELCLRISGVEEEVLL
jgi:DNA polymerase-3 subunit delta